MADNDEFVDFEMEYGRREAVGTITRYALEEIFENKETEKQVLI